MTLSTLKEGCRACYPRRMNNPYRIPGAFLFYPFLLSVLTIPSRYCFAIDTLTRSQHLSAEQTLISSGQIFELGFFSPGNSSKQYVGLWYRNISIHKVVWVLNRENPLLASETRASLAIGEDGNLVLLDGNRNIVWSTNVSVRSNSSIAMLSDEGDFILKDDISGSTLWESFNYPSDTFLPGMMLGRDLKTGDKRPLSCWQADDNPSPGNFVVELSLDTPPQAFVWNGSKPYWRSGPWNKWKFIGIPGCYGKHAYGFNVQSDNQQGSAYLTLDTYVGQVVILVLTPVGSLKILKWIKETSNWDVTSVAPGNPCDIYGVCGPFSVCNEKSSPICECLKGFIPKSIEDWNRRNWTAGCVRRTELLCQRNTSSMGLGKAKNDGFKELNEMKLPDHFEYLYTEDPSGCRQWCMNNCSCVAYAYADGIGCMVWAGDIMDVQQFSINEEVFFLRLAYSELVEDRTKNKLIISFLAISGVILLGFILLYWRRTTGNQRGNKRDKQMKTVLADPMDNSQENLRLGYVTQRESLELPIFDFDEILVATNNFSRTNKLGEGGFGPVYKGKLEDGKEVAVKRLSSHSNQGTEEFKNEIILISKLQHRNLVRLWGCCIQGEERLLIYEYMTNGSLDTFLFDPKRSAQLDWAQRFSIIQGIARGLLYLHRDSCLRVIHRDLKASNILLDVDMNPKISDFGLARTFRVTQELANTNRVVGTFGYMSPEYTIGGLFSEKSDVFSFGVLLLEIISGMRNSKLHYEGNCYLNLLGYAWQLWSESKTSNLIDQSLADSYPQSEVMRCIHIAFLCVQDHAVDRPNMSAVLLMLGNELDLPQPKQPTLAVQSFFYSHVRSQGSNISSRNEVSMTSIEGR